MSSRFLVPLAVAAALAAPVAAYSDTAPGEPKGDWLFRVGLSQINPDETNLANVLGTRADVVVDSDISPTANVEYMLTNHIGTELLVAWPFTHGIDLKTTDGGVTRVGNVDVLPPTLSVNYHFFPNSNWRPYIGAGINYTMFSGEETRGALGGNRISLDDSIGAAGQVGIDVGGHDKWFLNANVRYIQIESDLEVDGANAGSVDINPWVYGLHVGYRLGAPAPLPAPAAEPPPPPPPPPAPAACVDSDGDGVCDEADKCPGTPAGTKVDKVGCPLEQTLKVLFDFDSAELRPESLTELERVVKFMNDVPFATALIEGHTDSIGTEVFNQGLSERRAKAVFDYLSSRGVDPARLKSIGHGELKPIADNATAEGRQLNRRVMLIRTDAGM